MEKFKQAAKENRVEKVVKHYLKYTVLIIDEIGYLPVDEAAAFGFFQLIAARYEYRPTILTTNQPFSKWPDVFGDTVIANAIIDRLVKLALAENAVTETSKKVRRVIQERQKEGTWVTNAP